MDVKTIKKMLTKTEEDAKLRATAMTAKRRLSLDATIEVGTVKDRKQMFEQGVCTTFHSVVLSSPQTS